MSSRPQIAFALCSRKRLMWIGIAAISEVYRRKNAMRRPSNGLSVFCRDFPFTVPWAAESRDDPNVLGSSLQPVPLRALPL